MTAVEMWSKRPGKNVWLRVIIGTLLVSVLLALVSGCGPAPAPVVVTSTDGADITVHMGRGFIFNPDQIQIRAGQPVTLWLINVDSIPHTFTIDELYIDVELGRGDDYDLVLTVEEPGSFEFYCTIPGHRPAGQVGTLLID